MLRTTVDTESLHRMRHALARDVAPHRLFTRDHFQNVFGYPIEGEPHRQGGSFSRFFNWLLWRSPLGGLAARLRDGLQGASSAEGKLARRLAAELLKPELLESFMQAIARRLPPGGVPLQHLEDALAMGLRRAPHRRTLSIGATPALRLAESIYDAMFCATYAYYDEVIRSPGLAMAYAQGYAETISGVALGRTLEQAETYRPILGGGGYYEYMEARQEYFLRGAQGLGHAKVHFAPLRLQGGLSEDSPAASIY